MSDPKPPSALFVSVLALITLVGSLSLHLFFPATPAVEAGFAVSEAMAQLTISVPLFTMAAMTLVYGSLSDRYGRRRVLLAGILLFVAGSALSALADSIWMLIAGRLIQAAGGASGVALARAIARDVFGADRLVRVIAYLTMAYALGPMVAPPIGGILVDLSGWRAVLWFACAGGLAIFGLAWITLYETRAGQGRPAGTKSFLSDFGRLFGDLRFSGFVFQSGLCSGAFFTMATSASFLMNDYLGRPAAEYGTYFMLFPTGYWAGNFLASRLGGRVAIETMVLAGSLVLIATAAGQAAYVTLGGLSPLALFIPGCLVTFAQGLALPNAQAGAMNVEPALAGTAAGIGAFMQMFAAGVFSQLYGFLSDGTPGPMIVVVCAASTLSLLAGTVPFLLARKSKAPDARG